MKLLNILKENNSREQFLINKAKAYFTILKSGIRKQEYYQLEYKWNIVDPDVKFKATKPWSTDDDSKLRPTIEFDPHFSNPIRLWFKHNHVWVPINGDDYKIHFELLKDYSPHPQDVYATLLLNIKDEFKKEGIHLKNFIV